MKAKAALNGKIYLNIGCGSHYSPDWNNLDMNVQPGVIRHDVRGALPYDQEVFDAVYSSHVLEHLIPSEGEFLLREQYRVLKRGGCCRIVVPDLEKLCRDYLDQLQKMDHEPSPVQVRNYQWSVLFLIDQMVRDESGGEMFQMLRKGDFDREFLRSRYGDEFAGFMDRPQDALVPEGLSIKALLRAFKRTLFKALQLKSKSLARTSGEAHRWMYDRVSLGLVTAQIGFSGFRVVTHEESGIPDWDKYRLDESAKGPYPRKPDSLFVEVTKP